MRGRMDKSSSLGMPMSPQEILKRYKRQSLGMPKASPSSTKASGNSSLPFIMLHMHCVILGASFGFTFSISLFPFSINWHGPHHSCFGGDTRSVFIAKERSVFTSSFSASVHFLRLLPLSFCFTFAMILVFLIHCSQVVFATEVSPFCGLESCFA